MASNYDLIRKENQQRYGTDIGRIGPMLLADRYDDRTHFIFELLQNAEDALGKRDGWNGKRSATFTLEPTKLTLSHFGRPFDEADVRGVCGIAESTKDRLSIGRFGIGFKSVYTFTDRPEIHSGDEDFTIENYVWPSRARSAVRHSDETLIVLPLKPNDTTALDEIIDGFQRLGPSALLFLHYIDEINWSIRDGAAGTYLRSNPTRLGENVYRVTLIGQESGQLEIDQKWLVFNRDVYSPENDKIGRVEVAFDLQAQPDQPDRWNVVPVAISPLVVFFPTAVETNLGFLVQGPYRTTPSRDNVPRHDPWNKYLVEVTAELLVEALRWLRDQSRLDISTLRCLPLDREKFPDGSMFAPVFSAVRKALGAEPVLPKFSGGYVAASRAKLARTQDLRELFSPEQLTQLFGGNVSAWLTSEITQDRTPEIRQYLMQELGVTEVTPATIVPRLTRDFLEAQCDNWVLRLYEFLYGQERAIRRQLDKAPLVRLSDGKHVAVREHGMPSAFLPGAIETGFPTVCRAVCSTAESRGFLILLGITEPDLVDDVVWNVLPQYQGEHPDVDKEQYAKDIERIRAAFDTDSKAQREKLLSSLRETKFLMATGAGRGNRIEKPGAVYLATDRLKRLFSGIPDVMLVDDSYPCLRGEAIRELLDACGAVRYPRPVAAPRALTYSELKELRQQAGHEQTSGINDRIEDWELQGFEELIDILPTLSAEQRDERARLIWESLGELEERRGRGIFEGIYTWSHYGSYKKEFPAAFVRRLTAAAWIPDTNGELQPPRLVVFDTLGWKANPFLLSQITFKPPIIDQLAKEAGIDPAALDLLRKLGITSVADLTSRLGIIDPPGDLDEDPELSSKTDLSTDEKNNVYDDARDLYGDDMPIIPSVTLDPNRGHPPKTQAGNSSSNQVKERAPNNPNAIDQYGPGSPSHYGGHVGGIKNSGGTTKRNPGSYGGGLFISYLGVEHDEHKLDPDGLSHADRMQIEEQAISFIIKLEPALKRTLDGNPGFDLFEIDGNESIIRWVEVKSMTGSLEDRPVGVSRTQFELAMDKREAYWLYIVEHANDNEKARVLKIQDPGGQARTFTFDKGWADIAHCGS